MNDAYAIILAGGNGDRFWPLSTPDLPKQFLSIFGNQPLLRQSVERLKGLIPPEKIYILTATRFYDLTREAVPQIPAENIILEPCRRETASAVATACGIVMRNGGSQAVGCILTSDHLISPPEIFRQNISDSMALALKTSAIVTLGIKPNRAETGFGYIEADGVYNSETKTKFHRVRRFVEKPDEATAKEYIASGKFLWNAGMFVWRAEILADAFKRFAPGFSPLVNAVSEMPKVSDALEMFYPSMQTISFDFAVMEHATEIFVGESRFDWDDVGSWIALERHFAQTPDGNTVLGSVVNEDNENSVLVNAGGKNHRLVVAGVSNLVVVETENATLVCSKKELSKMKKLVSKTI